MSPLSETGWLPTRIGNALVGYVSYLGMTLWPRPLAVFYPFAAAPAVAAGGRGRPAGGDHRAGRSGRSGDDVIWPSAGFGIWGPSCR